jgi:hypothetical protein
VEGGGEILNSDWSSPHRVCHVGSQKGVAGLREGSGSFTLSLNRREVETEHSKTKSHI